MVRFQKIILVRVKKYILKTKENVRYRTVQVQFFGVDIRVKGILPYVTLL